MKRNDRKAGAREIAAAPETSADDETEKTRTDADETAQPIDGPSGVFEGTRSILRTGIAGRRSKPFEMTRSNLDANFAFARDLLGASTPVEAFDLQKRFAENRIAALRKQTGELGSLASKVAEAAIEPTREGLLKSFDEAGKAFSVWARPHRRFRRARPSARVSDGSLSGRRPSIVS